MVKKKGGAGALAAGGLSAISIALLLPQILQLGTWLAYKIIAPQLGSDTASIFQFLLAALIALTAWALAKDAIQGSFLLFLLMVVIRLLT